MKRELLVGIGLALALAGCSSNGKADPNADQVVPINTIEIKYVPMKAEESELGIVSGRSRIRVGDPIADVDQAFPRPERKVVEFRDLPPGFGSAFRSRGWETDAEGVGTISAEGSIVVAVRTTKGLEEDQVQTILRKYSDRIPLEQPSIQGQTARYWFSEDQGRRLMICAVKAEGGAFEVIEAIGEDSAMNALRMNSLAADKDLARADQMAREASSSDSKS